MANSGIPPWSSIAASATANLAAVAEMQGVEAGGGSGVGGGGGIGGGLTGASGFPGAHTTHNVAGGNADPVPSNLPTALPHPSSLTGHPNPPSLGHPVGHAGPSAPGGFPAVVPGDPFTNSFRSTDQHNPAPPTTTTPQNWAPFGTPAANFGDAAAASGGSAGNVAAPSIAKPRCLRLGAPAPAPLSLPTQQLAPASGWF